MLSVQFTEFPFVSHVFSLAAPCANMNKAQGTSWMTERENAAD